MKRIILFLFILMSSGRLWANHWTPNGVSYENNMTLTGIVQINGVEQQNTMLEVGVFCGEECRGSDMLVYFAPTQSYVVQLLVFGTNGDPLTFKLFDHGLNQELDLVSPDAVIFTMNGCGSLTNPYVLNFSEICAISASANPIEAGTVTGGGLYLHGAIATLSATANSGYTFVNWTLGNSIVSTEATINIEVIGSANYIANFSSNHWMPNSVAYEDNMTVTGVVQINSVEQQTSALEVGVFCNEECRGAGRLAYFPITQRYVIQLVVYGNEGDQLTFKLYDHALGQEFNLNSPDAVAFVANGYGSLVNPYILNFIELHNIMVSHNPEEGGTASGDGTYLHEQTCTLIATPNEGYAFVNWTKDGIEISTETTYNFTVTEDATFVAHFEEIVVDITQTTTFAEGWNWWSTYVDQSDIDGLTMLEEGLGDDGVTVKSQGDGFVQYMNYGGYTFWYGTLDHLANSQTYMVQTDAAVQVEMTGAPVATASMPITISEGWNWIGFPSTNAMAFETAFAGITPSDGDIVKSQNSFAQYMEYGGYGFWYGGLNTSTIIPGMGLMYYSQSSESFSFTYPLVSRSIIVNEIADDRHWTNNVHAYPTNMTVLAVVELNDIEIRSDNYELAAFANGECRGSVRLTYVEPLNRYMAFLTISGDEAASLSFGLYDTETGMECYESSDMLVYATDAMLGSFDEPKVIRFRGTTGFDDIDRNLQVYPNPVKRGERFSINLSVGSEVRVDIVNALGAIVSTETSTKAPASLLAPNVIGIYTLRITVDGEGTYCMKLVVR